jgi:hypothetical protein
MRLVESMLEVVDVADDAIRLANLNPRVVLRASGARRGAQQCAERADDQEPYPHSARKKHRVPYKIAGFFELTWQG